MTRIRRGKDDHYCPLREEGLGGTTWLNGCPFHDDCFTCTRPLELCPAENPEILHRKRGRPKGKPIDKGQKVC